LWPLCVLGYISAVVVEDGCVRDCSVLGMCMVGTVSLSVGGECMEGGVVR
jgi:hypothetical protein